MKTVGLYTCVTQPLLSLVHDMIHEHLRHGVWGDVHVDFGVVRHTGHVECFVHHPARAFHVGVGACALEIERTHKLSVIDGLQTGVRRVRIVQELFLVTC